MIHIVERILVVIGGRRMVGIFERIRLFMVTYARPCAPFRRWGVRGRFMSLVLLGAAMVLQLPRVSVFARSAFACFAQSLRRDAGEDEKGEVDDSGRMVLAICSPLCISTGSERRTVATLKRHLLRFPSSPECR